MRRLRLDGGGVKVEGVHEGGGGVGGGGGRVGQEGLG